MFGDAKGGSMPTSYWRYLIGGLFTLGFLATLLGFLFLQVDKTAVGTVMVVTAGGLVLVAALPQLTEFSIGLKGVTAKLARVEDKVDEQQRLINQLVHYSMSASIFHHLCGIAILHSYVYNNDEPSRRELYFLRDHGFIRPKRGIDFVVFENLNGRNLVEIAEPTEIGWVCVKLRKAEIPSNMLDAINRTNVRVEPSGL
jgi:hypothetical protein